MLWAQKFKFMPLSCLSGLTIQSPWLQETSFSASGSHHSLDSMEGSFRREHLSPQSNTIGVVKHAIGRQHSASSQFCAPYGFCANYESPHSNHSSDTSLILGPGRLLQNQRENFGSISNGIAASTLQNAGFTRNFLENEEVTGEELQAEAKMWELNARKLMIDQDLLRKEFADQTKQLENMDVELSASHAECDVLKQEIQRLKVLLEESTEKQKATQNIKSRSTDKDNIQKVLEDEMKYQQELNNDLALQLKKTQDSNLELVSILQEMEETIEKQKSEMESLKTPKSKLGDTSKRCSFGHEENREVNSSEEVVSEKMGKPSCDSDWEGSIFKHPVTDLGAEYDKEEKRKLEFQLQQLQETQKNRENTILHLEKALRDKIDEIETERDLRTRTLLDSETEWRLKLTAKEEEVINLESKLSKALGTKDAEVAESENRGDIDLIKEIETLKARVQELERDCNELTDENLELLLKLKKTGDDLPTKGASSDSSSNIYPALNPPLTSEYEVSKLKYQICPFEKEIRCNKIPIKRVAMDHLQIHCVDFEDKCTDIKLQSQASKNRTCYLDTELQYCHSRAEELETEIAAPQQQLDCCQGEKIGTDNHSVDVHLKLKNPESQIYNDKFAGLNELAEELQFFLVNVKKIQYSAQDNEHARVDNDSNRLKFATLNELEGSVLRNLVLLKKLFEMKIADLKRELLAKTCQIGDYNGDLLFEKEESKALRSHQRHLETKIFDLQKLKEEKAENTGAPEPENRVTSKWLDNFKSNIRVVSGKVESHVADNKVVERKLEELESANHELEVHLSELEEENVHLSARVSGLEAQLRYLTDAREASRLELQRSESIGISLQNDIRRLKNEMEEQKISMKHKLEDMQKRWLEAQEECEYLKKANPKLQSTAESLIEECSSLQKSNGLLRQQKVELHKHCNILELELRESQNSFSKFFKKIESLEARFFEILEELTSKEKLLNLELDALLQQNKHYKEKLDLWESLNDQKYFDNPAEEVNLQLEVALLSSPIPETHNARKGSESEEALEMHALHADKGGLEPALQKVQENIKCSQKIQRAIQINCETRILSLTNELAASKEKYEILVYNHEKLLGLSEDVRSKEDKLKRIINELELKLKSSEQERLQLAEEISSLNIQLQKIPQLQDEVLTFKGSLYGSKCENERLWISLQLLSGDFEELKAEKASLVQKVNDMQEAMSELENCRHYRTTLEEKILRLQGDLKAQEALCAQDAKLKNELGQVKRVNSQFQWKIKYLEEEKEDWLQKAQALEEELKQNKIQPDHYECSGKHSLLGDQTNDTNILDQKLKLSEQKEEADVTKSSKVQPELSVKSGRLPPLLQNQAKQATVQSQTKDYDRQYDSSMNSTTSANMTVDTVSRTQYLENELAEALEANEMYKVQLKSLLAKLQICNSDSQKKSEVENESISKEEYKQRATTLEAELIEIRERYLDISLKYAEVEDQREQLVMKLKAVNSGKRWL
ncbi:hypothetical protein NMG60_11020294 [Bertholletia excelsa]